MAFSPTILAISADLGRSWSQLESARAQPWHFFRHLTALRLCVLVIEIHTRRFRTFSAMFSSSWKYLGLSWASLLPYYACLTTILGESRMCGSLQPPWGHLWPCWAVFGPSWSHLGTILKPCWGQVGFLSMSSCASMGPSYAHLGEIRGQLVPLFGHLRIVFGHLGHVLGPSLAFLGYLEAILGNFEKSLGSFRVSVGAVLG